MFFVMYGNYVVFFLMLDVVFFSNSIQYVISKIRLVFY